MNRAALLVLSLLLMLPNHGALAEVHDGVPQNADPTRKYLFYMHGAWIEMHGTGQAHPRHGPYRYDEILRILAEKGYEVIGEVRSGAIHPPTYAKEVAEQILFLLKKGVPAKNITVSGHSKGGHMSLLVASMLGEPEINYVILAGCGKKGTSFRNSYEKFLNTSGLVLTGRILSIYDASDQEAGSCQEAFHWLQKGEVKEIVLRTGRGHGLFYAPDPSWMDWVVRWAQ